MTSIGGGFSPYDKKEIIQSIVSSQEKAGRVLQEETRGLLRVVTETGKTKLIEKLTLIVCIIGAGAAIIGAVAGIMAIITK